MQNTATNATLNLQPPENRENVPGEDQKLGNIPETNLKPPHQGSDYQPPESHKPSENHEKTGKPWEDQHFTTKHIPGLSHFTSRKPCYPTEQDKPGFSGQAASPLQALQRQQWSLDKPTWGERFLVGLGKWHEKLEHDVELRWIYDFFVGCESMLFLAFSLGCLVVVCSECFLCFGVCLFFLSPWFELSFNVEHGRAKPFSFPSPLTQLIQVKRVRSLSQRLCLCPSSTKQFLLFGGFCGSSFWKKWIKGGGWTASTLPSSASLNKRKASVIWIRSWGWCLSHCGCRARVAQKPSCRCRCRWHVLTVVDVKMMEQRCE